jgi:hypothetical protein
VQGRKLVANVDQREGNLLHLRLIDPSDPNAADDPLACLNADLVREGESSRVESYIGFEFERIMYGWELVLTPWQVWPPLTRRVDTSARTRKSSRSSRLVRRLLSDGNLILPTLINSASDGAKADRLGIFEWVVWTGRDERQLADEFHRFGDVSED